MTKEQRRIAKLRYIMAHEQGERRKKAFICLMLSTDIVDAYVSLLCAHPSQAEMRDIEQTFLLDALHKEIVATLQFYRNIRYWKQFDFQGIAEITPLISRVICS